MFYSLAAVLVLVFGIWAISPSPPETQRRPAEYGLAASNAAEVVDWQVWSPQGLSDEWTPSTVSFSRHAEVDQTLRMGWITPQQEYVESRQAEDPSEQWVAQVIPSGMTAQELVAVEGPTGTADWELFTGLDANDAESAALLLPPADDQSATTIVSGTASIPELMEYIEALETQ